ncbi:hypothetical protein ACOMHN_025892 [Nucella lapillus]
MLADVTTTTERTLEQPSPSPAMERTLEQPPPSPASEGNVEEDASSQWPVPAPRAMDRKLTSPLPQETESKDKDHGAPLLPGTPDTTDADPGYLITP